MILAHVGFPALALCIIPWLRLVLSEDRTYDSVLDAFPELEALNKQQIKDPISGGQDFDYCCLLAVNASYELVNGSVKPMGLFINESVTGLQSQQWPCGASYTGNKSGAPEVVAPYQWVRQHCPGWQENRGSKVDDWTQLFVGFLLPAVAFCLIVPRQQELKLPRALFDVELGQVSGLLSSPFLALAAGLLVTIDTVYWLIVVFTFTGPILLSGLYEAVVDKRMLAFIRDKIDNGRLSRTDRARILFAILVGNLDLAWGSHDGQEGQAWLDTQSLVAELEEAEKGLLTPNGKIDRDRLESSTKSIKVRLRTMLACQFPFGSTVGAPVVFFLGSFGYALKEISDNLGRNSSSHALAYGTFWIVMPLESIVVSCLLAGNNPNTLEGIVGRREIMEPYPTFFGFVPSFDTGYKPAWMWNRGRNKQHWAEAIARRYHVDDLRKRVAIGNRDLAKLYSVVLVLLLIPCALAFTVSYLTPKTGLGCRSVDFMMFFFLQVLLVGMWVWKYLENGFVEASQLPTLTIPLPSSSPTAMVPGTETGNVDANDDRDGEKSATADAEMDEEGGKRCPTHRHKSRHAQHRVRRRRHAWLCTVAFLALCSCFFGIGGTVMQLVGVYQNGLCLIPLSDWLAKESTILLSTNSHAAISLAQYTWIPVGVTAAAYLCFICCVGWWYNTYLRLQFDEMVDAFDEEKVRTSTFVNVKSDM